MHDSMGQQTRPPGFHLVFLPYADDIRSLKFDPSAIAEDELILKAKKGNFTLTVSVSQSHSTHCSTQFIACIVQTCSG